MDGAVATVMDGLFFPGLVMKVGQRQVRHRLLLHATFNFINMRQYENVPCRLTAQKVIQNFLDHETEPIDIERLCNDMLIHYLRPTNDWNLAREHRKLAIENAEILLELLRGIGELRKEI